MKKVVSVALAGAIAASMSACSNNEKAENNKEVETTKSITYMSEVGIPSVLYANEFTGATTTNEETISSTTTQSTTMPSTKTKVETTTPMESTTKITTAKNVVETTTTKDTTKEIIFECDRDFVVSEDLTKKIEGLIKNYNGEVGFYIETEDRSFSYEYNSEKEIFGASTMKIPLAMLICQSLEKNNYNLNHKFDISNMDFKDGVLKEHPKYYPDALLNYYTKDTLTNNIYTTRDLMTLMIKLSDNSSKEILMNYYTSVNEYNSFVKKLGCNNSYIPSGKTWARTCAKDLAIMWEKLNEYAEVSEYGNFLLETSKDCKWTELKCLDSEVASKYGYTLSPEKVYLDSGIVYKYEGMSYNIGIITTFKGSEFEEDFIDDLLKSLDSVMGQYYLYLNQDLSK